jgi:hypothetical protein
MRKSKKAKKNKLIKNEENTFIDMSYRTEIEITYSKKRIVSDEELKKFTEKLEIKCNEFYTFAETCLNRNISNNKKDITEENFKASMESMLEENQLLKDILEHRLKTNKEKEKK